LLVFRDNRPVESYTRVGEVKYLKHFLAVSHSAALSRQRMVAIAISYLTFSYYAKYRTYNERKIACANHRWTAVDFAVLFRYCGTIKYHDIWVIIINSFFAPHNTTLYYFLFYVRCQDMCLHVYGIATVNRQCKVLFIYPLINLSSKKTTQKQI